MLYEEQYRQAVLHDSVAVYQVNITRDRIDEEFAQYLDDGSTDMLTAVALKAPCSYRSLIFCFSFFCASKLLLHPQQILP